MLNHRPAETIDLTSDAPLVLPTPMQASPGAAQHNRRVAMSEQSPAFTFQPQQPSQQQLLYQWQHLMPPSVPHIAPPSLLGPVPSTSAAGAIPAGYTPHHLSRTLPPNMSLSAPAFSSARRTSVIDLTDTPSPSTPTPPVPLPSSSTRPHPMQQQPQQQHRPLVLPTAPQPHPNVSRDTQPICIGQLKVTCLVLWASHYVMANRTLDDVPGRPPSPQSQLAPVKLVYVAPRKGNLHEAAGETINVLQPGTQESFGVLEQRAANVLGPMLGRGLLRIDARLSRTTEPHPTILPVYLLIFTLPPNVPTIADLFIKAKLYLDHPQTPYDPAKHHGAPYSNPHNPPPGGFGRVSNSVGPSTSAIQPAYVTTSAKTVEVQRTQVEEMFKSLRPGTDLRETQPTREVGTKLYPHQKQALTFLLEREGELVGGFSIFKEIGERSRKRWKCMVTSKEFDKLPEMCKGAILADDMGLGKTITIVALISSTMQSARKHAGSSSPRNVGRPGFPKVFDAPLTAAHFAGSVWGMPSAAASAPSLSTSSNLLSVPTTAKGKSKAEKAEKSEKKRRQAEEARQARLRCRSRATLIVCPLSTVVNWEDQLREHWAGKVTVVGGGGVPVLPPAPYQAQVDVPFGQPGLRVQPKKEEAQEDSRVAPLKVYVYHGNARRPDPDYLADFDVVITTYSTLATEFSRQLRTGQQAEEGDASSDDEAGTGSGSGARSGTRTPAVAMGEDGEVDMEGGQSPWGIGVIGSTGGYVDDDGDSDILEVDGESMSERRDREHQQMFFNQQQQQPKSVAGVKRKRTIPSVEIPSPLQQVDWFRVVLDEAHSIKETSTVACRAACDLIAQRRICLTGTPVQNKLDDIYALIKFIRLQPFDDKAIWTEFIGGPCKFGQALGVARLQTIMKAITLRRTKETKSQDGRNILSLPPRKDELRMLQFDPDERRRYDQVFNASKSEFDAMSKNGEVMKNYVGILQRILRLRQICCHWQLVQDKGAGAGGDDSDLEPEELINVIQRDGINLARATAVFNLLRESATTQCVECGYELAVASSPTEELETEFGNGTAKKSKKSKPSGPGTPGFLPRPLITRCQHLFCMRCLHASVYPDWPKVQPNIRRPCSICRTTLSPADIVQVSPDGTMPVDIVTSGKGKTTAAKRKEKAERQLAMPGQDVVMSTKIKTLLNDLMVTSRANPFSRNYSPEMCEIETIDNQGNITGDGIVKTVVFSQWTSMLDKIEDALNANAIHFDRLDGTMRREERTKAMESLKTNPACEVLLVSLRAGGVGLNLTAAQRVYLMDPYWNPAVENQAVDRIHRLGQTKPVTTIKLVIEDTVEARMLEVQKRKTALANMTLGGPTLTRSQISERRMEELRVLFR